MVLSVMMLHQWNSFGCDDTAIGNQRMLQGTMPEEVPQRTLGRAGRSHSQESDTRR